jgi:Holliday junction resolvasome RuvABC endonuclease subunit
LGWERTEINYFSIKLLVLWKNLGLETTCLDIVCLQTKTTSYWHFQKKKLQKFFFIRKLLNRMKRNFSQATLTSCLFGEKEEKETLIYEFEFKKPREEKIFIGIDLSLKSPAVACFTNNTWHLFGFAQKVSEASIIKKQIAPHAFVTFLPRIPKSSVADMIRFDHIVTHLMKQICNLVETSPKKVLITMEGYVYSGDQSGFSYKNHELGGLLKHAIWKKLGIAEINLVVPPSWKKAVVGHGHATKYQTFQYVQEKLGVNLLKAHSGLKASEEKGVDNPIEDIGDAMCICMYPLQNQQKPIKKSKIRVT